MSETLQPTKEVKSVIRRPHTVQESKPTQEITLHEFGAKKKSSIERLLHLTLVLLVLLNTTLLFPTTSHETKFHKSVKDHKFLHYKFFD